MQDLDTSKLKRAMIDVAILRAERTVKDDQEPVVVHPLYRERWERTVRELQVRRLRKKRKTRVLAFIIAAVVAALAGCAWTYREKIADFWVTAFDRYDKLEIDDIGEDFPRTIEEVYIPTYVPEGYEQVYYQKDSLKIWSKWEKDGNYLIYMQSIISGNYNLLDSEKGEYVSKQLGDKIVFCHFYNGRQIVIWIKGYEFRLASSKEIIDEELIKIINSVQKFEENRP